jgi:hypothetical protein
METIEQLKHSLPEAMTMAAFTGIAWYLCVELNIRLYMVFTRHRGLYFWSCFLCSWGILVKSLATLLVDFDVWKDKVAAMVVIYFAWFFMVIPQSFVLYSRLHLVMSNCTRLRWVLFMIIFNSVVFSAPTIVLGILSVSAFESLR